MDNPYMDDYRRPPVIDLSQAHSTRNPDDLAAEFRGSILAPGQSQVATSDFHPPVTLEGLREGLVKAVQDLQAATAEAFQGFDERTAQYYTQIDERLNAVVNHASELEVVLDSLIKLFVLSEKMPPDVLMEHQSVLATFLKRDIPQEAGQS